MSKVLDVCCGSKAFWYDKDDSRVIFIDRRFENVRRGDSSNPHGFRVINVMPDIIADFTALPFKNNLFSFVVFDPPHLKTLGPTSYMAKTYGVLPENWQDILRWGFLECFRVLAESGVLIFKWCEDEITLKTILALTDRKPLFGHRRKDNPMKTHWVSFIKL
jgi:hypothetical protein